MKLLIDMNLTPVWVEFLAASGFESIHWSTVGDPTAPDGVILDYAAANGFIIFTHDLDFGALLADRGAVHPSVMQIRTQDVLPAAIGPVVVRALNASRQRLEVGAIVTVDPGRNRIRLLPI